MKRISVVLCMMLAACSGSSRHTASPTTTKTTAPAGTANSCQAADLRSPVLSIPVPHYVTTPVVLPRGRHARIDPAPGAHPAINAVTAWRIMTADPLHASRAELLLGTFSGTVSVGPGKSSNVRLLAWVARIHHLAYPYPPNDPDVSLPAAAATTTPVVCLFTDAYLVIDANTGRRVLYVY